MLLLLLLLNSIHSLQCTVLLRKQLNCMRLLPEIAADLLIPALPDPGSPDRYHHDHLTPFDFNKVLQSTVK